MITNKNAETETFSANQMNVQLSLAATAGDAESVQKWLKAGAQPNVRPSRGGNQGFALVEAAKSNSIECVNLLIAAGADLNIKNDECNGNDSAGRTAMFFAGQNDDTTILETLIKSGATITADLLYNAVENGCLSSVKCLIKHGAEVNSKYGFELTTPLHVVNTEKEDWAEIARALLEAGSDPMILDSLKHSAIYTANKNYRNQVYVLSVNSGMKADQARKTSNDEPDGELVMLIKNFKK